MGLVLSHGITWRISMTNQLLSPITTFLRRLFPELDICCFDAEPGALLEFLGFFLVKIAPV
jgi:hypothetical protein